MGWDLCTRSNVKNVCDAVYVSETGKSLKAIMSITVLDTLAAYAILHCINNIYQQVLK